MLKYFILLFLTTTSLTYSQKKTSLSESKKTNYKDFVVRDNKVYAISMGDSLVSWDIASKKTTVITNNAVGVCSTGKDVYFIDNNGAIKSISGKLKYQVNYQPGSFYKLITDKKNNFIVVTKEGIFYNNKIYFPPALRGYSMGYSYEKFPDRWMFEPSAYFVSNNNILWLGFDRGEFGGGMLYFDLKKFKFLDEHAWNYFEDRYEDIEYNTYNFTKYFPDEVFITQTDTVFRFPLGISVINVKGITQDSKDNIFISESLMHFFLEGSLSKIEEIKEKGFYRQKKLDYLIDIGVITDTVYDGEKMHVFKMRDVKEYLGPISYNSYDGNIYFYSDRGFFKVINANDGGFKRELFYKPNINWEYGMAHSLGYAMNVIEFEFIGKDELLFLTSGNGIGYYNGADVYYLN